jgi:hypothetical protein
MKHLSTLATTLAALITITAGCASQPATVAALPQPAADCRQLGADIAGTESARHEAAEKQQNAWKAVVPFVVAARFAEGKSAVAEADQRLAELQGRFEQQGCTGRAN